MNKHQRPFIPCQIEHFTYCQPSSPSRLVVKALFPISVRDMEDFRAYGTHTGWTDQPSSQSVLLLTRSLEQCAKRSFSSRSNRCASRKTILAEIRERMASGPVENVSIFVFRETWDLIEANARFYGISPTEHCLCCLGYHAALWREMEKSKRPTTSFEFFERALAKEARQKRQPAI